MSLRARLAVFISVMLLAGVVLNFIFDIMTAREQIAREMHSTSRLASEFLGMVWSDASVRLQPGRAEEIVNRLMQLKEVRHLEVDILPASLGLTSTGSSRSPAAPAWFVAAVAPPPVQLISTFALSGGDHIVVRSNSAMEIEEAWRETRRRLTAAVLGFLLFNGLLYFFLTRWLRPAQLITRTLEDIERGDFSRRIPRMRLPELEMIAQKMNRLASVLGASKSENERLTRKSLMIQEQERRHLAQELHDAMGQSISAIKAMAVSIRERGRGDALIEESALKIEEASGTIYSSVKGMIGRLRPVVLDELGLVPALQQMADDWNTHHEDAFCRLRIEGEFDDLLEEQQISVFRIVQEALTNIARHARATSVEVILSGREVVTLMISDNGVGYDAERVEKGMGLMNLRERVRTLLGELTISSRPHEGVTIQIEFPRINNRRRRRATDVWPAR